MRVNSPGSFEAGADGGAAGLVPSIFPNICVNSPTRFGPEPPGACGVNGCWTAGLCGSGPAGEAGSKKFSKSFDAGAGAAVPVTGA